MRIELINLLTKENDYSICGICKDMKDALHVVIKIDNKDAHFKICEDCIKQLGEIKNE